MTKLFEKVLKGPISVDVTEENLKRGHPCSASACPVADALVQALGASAVLVYSREARVWADNKEVVLSHDAAETIRAIDSGKQVNPFSVKLKRV